MHDTAEACSQPITQGAVDGPRQPSLCLQHLVLCLSRTDRMVGFPQAAGSWQVRNPIDKCSACDALEHGVPAAHRLHPLQQPGSAHSKQSCLTMPLLLLMQARGPGQGQGQAPSRLQQAGQAEILEFPRRTAGSEEQQQVRITRQCISSS